MATLNLAEFVKANNGNAGQTAKNIIVDGNQITLEYQDIAITAAQVTDFTAAVKTAIESYDYIVCGGAQL